MHLCRALRGLAHCECHAGYRLAADRKTCEGRTPFPRAAPPKGHLQRDPVPLDQPGCVLLHRPFGCRAGLGLLSAAGPWAWAWGWGTGTH